MLKLDDIIADSRGRFITVLFIKKDGSLRKMTCRTGVTRHLKGGQSTLDPTKYLTVYDVEAAGYRAINRQTIVSVTADGVTVWNNKLGV